MQTEKLSEIPHSIRDEYIGLLQDIAISEGVAPDITEELLKAKQWTEVSTFSTGKPTVVKVSVDKPFPIVLDSQDEGRVFELAGQSDRNKTTSLIYMATLLGINWDETRPFLDRDDKVYTTATQRVCRALSQGQNAQLQIKSKNYELSIVITNGCATVSLSDEFSRFLPDFNSRPISLTSSEDWEEYRKLMKTVCDVQFVGKSRDFIGQVSIEECKDLALFCKIVLDRAGLMRRYLQNLPRGRTAHELNAEISNIKIRLAEVKKEIDGFSHQIGGYQRLIQDAQELIATYRELEDTHNTEIREVLRRLKLEGTVRNQDKKRQDFERRVQDLTQELERVQQKLRQDEPRYTSLKVGLEGLRAKISNELKNLSILSDLCSQLLRETTNKDYGSLITFCTYALVNDETLTLLDSILEVTRPFSKALIIPFDSASEPGMKLNDLEKKLSAARSMTVDIQKLNPELAQAYQAIQTVQISTAYELRRLETEVTTSQTIATNKSRLLEENREELGVINQTIKSLLRDEDFKSLKVRIDELRQALPDEYKALLEKVERLSNGIGYNEPWQLNLSDIQAVIGHWHDRIRELRDSMATQEKKKSQLEDRLFDIQQSSSGPESRQREALDKLQTILGHIVEYLEEYSLRREGKRLYDPTELAQITGRFSAHVEKLDRTINRVITRRCPVMYKNRASGLVRLPVKDYDFLKEKLNVPDLQDGEWAGGGGDSAMTVYGLASRSSGSPIGTILLVDEFNDAETFKRIVCDDLADLEQLAFAIFVKQDPDLKDLSFEVLK